MEPAYRKYLRHEMNLIALLMLIQALISTLVVVGDYFLRGLLDALYHTPQTQRALEDFDKSALSSIIGVIAAFVVVFLMSRRHTPMRTIFCSGKKMTLPVFFSLLSVSMACQPAFSFFDWLFELLLNQFGLTAAASVEAATARSETLSMLVYACVIAPVFEELLARGVVMRRMQFAGKRFAVVVSAFLFGVMHANIPQAFFAFSVGLVLGYTAIEYSITYAILLHFINNFVFGDLFAYLAKPLPEAAAEAAYYLIFGVALLCCLITLISNRREIATWLRENRPQKGSYTAALTSVLMIVYFLMNLVLSLLLIKRLP